MLRPKLPPDQTLRQPATHRPVEPYAAGLSRKLGLFQPRPDDLSLAQDLLERMARNGADFTLIFRRLCDAAASPDGDAGVRRLFSDPRSFDDWAARWRHRLAEEGGEANRAAISCAASFVLKRGQRSLSVTDESPPVLPERLEPIRGRTSTTGTDAGGRQLILSEFEIVADEFLCEELLRRSH